MADDIAVRIQRAAQRVVRRFGKRAIRYVTNRHPRLADRIIDEMLAERYRIPFGLTHFYSPFPDIAAVKTRSARWHQKGIFEGPQWEVQKQRKFLDHLRAYKPELEGLPSDARLADEGYGLGYGPVESHFLHCMIRYFKPRKVVEVGSGVSTFFTLNALRLNRQEGHGRGEMVCIEPYPSSKIQELATQNEIRLVAKEVQDVGSEAFSELRENDVLFIDSSHVSKIDSDVNWLYLDILPRLASGVVIHIHDIPFPYLTAMPEHPLFDISLLWNEAALVKAFMTHNSRFDVLMCQSQLHYECPPAIKTIVSTYDERKNFPSSLWLVKTG